MLHGVRYRATRPLHTPHARKDKCYPTAGKAAAISGQSTWLFRQIFLLCPMLEDACKVSWKIPVFCWLSLAECFCKERDCVQQGPVFLWLGQPLALLSQSLRVLGGLKIDTMLLTNKHSFMVTCWCSRWPKKKRRKT